jgi:hypothetical protein
MDIHILYFNINFRLFNLADSLRFCDRLFLFFNLLHILVNLVFLLNVLTNHFLNFTFNWINWNIIDNIIFLMIVIHQRNLSCSLSLVSIFSLYFTIHYSIFFVCLCNFSLFTVLLVFLSFLRINLRWSLGIDIFFIVVFWFLSIKIFRLHNSRNLFLSTFSFLIITFNIFIDLNWL